MIRLDIAELRQSGNPYRLKREVPPEALTSESNRIGLENPVQVEVRALLKGDRVELDGHLETTLRLDCSRCLKGFPRQVRKTFRLVYTEDPVVSDGEELALSYEDLKIGFFRDDVIDLSAVIGEQIVLEIPMKIVCSDGCRGLCPQCGRDLNTGLCECRVEHVDPRWEGLADLKKRLGN